MIALLAGCGADTDPAKGPVRADLVVASYADSSRAQYADAVIGAERLRDAIDAFLDAPSADTLAAARLAWTTGRRSYMPTEARRGWDGPIDHAKAGPSDPLGDGPEVFINSWPLDENYLDYTLDNDLNPVLSGLVYDDTAMPVITAEALREANTLGGDGNISTGYHAIEFLLWGQDRNPNGPGQRSFEDYVVGATVAREMPARFVADARRSAVSDSVARAVDADGAVLRRRELLATLADMLIDDLRTVRDAWTPGSGWRASWSALPVKTALGRILAGASFLAKDELTNARIQTAFDLAAIPEIAAIDPGPGGSQEEEHSCFSDTTHLDIYDDVRAIETALTDVWRSPYAPEDDRSPAKVGRQSMFALLAAINPGTANKLARDLKASLDATRAMRDAGEAGEPFDRQILLANPTGRARVQHAIDTLNVLATTLDEAAASLSLSVTFIDDGD